MIPELRQDFNARFTPEKYKAFLARLDERALTHVKFRNCETPCFFPRELLNTMVTAGAELVRQLVGNKAYLDAARKEIPAVYLAPNETPYPHFLQADFGLIRDGNGNLAPRLVEIQGFPSLYCYQPVLAGVYREIYDLDPTLRHVLQEGDDFKKALLGNHAPENVVLVEIDPRNQKTLADFLLTEKLYGVRAVDIRDIKKIGRKLYANGIPIHRIYNRAIADELIRLNIQSEFQFSDDVDVEWAGHPNWFYLISKFSIPYLKHETVPESHFLSDVKALPEDLDNWVLKPLYSFAGLGVKVGVTKAEIDSIPAHERTQYLLQKRVRFEPVIETPHGATQAEIRVMYVWLDEPVAVTTIIRMGRGRMMGVDHNRDLEWVGASAGFYR